MQMIGTDDALYVLLENRDKACSHVAVNDLVEGSWRACPDIPLGITSASMAAHDGRLLVVGIHRDEDGDHSRMFSLDPSSGQWTQSDASNLPLANALVDCAGDLLVVGQLLGGIDSFRQPTRIARWELREAGTSTPYEVTEEDIVCTLAGTYTPTKKVGTHDLASYPPLVAVQGNCLYVADSYRTDTDGGGMGVALEKVARGKRDVLVFRLYEHRAPQRR